MHYGADENGNGGHTVDAKIIGRDPATDIALLKIDAGQSLPSVPLGDSDRIRKGDWAIAVGNPFQFENTLTVGVISAKGRSLGLGEHDPLVRELHPDRRRHQLRQLRRPALNINGEVVGINTAIRGGGAQGLGFATPINTAKRLLPQLKQGKVTAATSAWASSTSPKTHAPASTSAEARGALVQTVEPGMPADEGRHPARRRHRRGRRHIRSRNNRELIDYISYLPVGSKCNLTVIRNGKRQTLTAKTAERTLDDRQGRRTQAPKRSSRRATSSACRCRNSRRRCASSYGIADTVTGVVVTSVKEVSPAGDVLSEGDVISEVQGTEDHEPSTVPHRDRQPQVRPDGAHLRHVLGTRRRRVSGYRFIHVP